MATERRTVDAGGPGFSLSTASLIAGGGLLLMAVLSFASLPVVEGMRVPGDAAATVANVVESGILFRISVVAILSVIVLDVVIAAALYAFLRPVHRDLALLAALLRVTYAAIFGAALGPLLAIGSLIDGGAAGTVGADQLAVLVAANFDAFASVWEIGLAVSGVHLLAVAVLLARAEYVPTAVGALVAVAGAGYVIDPLSAVVLGGEGFGIIVVTFVGEVVLLAWLLYRGRTLETRTARHTGE